MLAQFGPPANRQLNRRASQPDMAPFVCVLLLLVGFSTIITRFRGQETGVVTDAQLPFSSAICWPPDAYESIISLNSSGQLSFAVPDFEKNLYAAPSGIWSGQATIIQRVALRHGIVFTPAQTVQLQTMPFLATDVEQLPWLLSLSCSQRNEFISLGKIKPLSKKQLSECVTACKNFAANTLLRQVYFSLRIDSKTRTSQVMSLIDLLQTDGINRFNLKGQIK